MNYGNNVQIETNKEEFATREKVELSLEPLLSPDDSVTSTLSVSVVSEDYLGSAGSSQNIKSYLLLDSELKGAIESPALYFFDEEKITAAEKLDLLMMVQGWRSYYWDEIIDKAPEDLKGWDDAGISVSGTLKRLRGDEPIADGKVQLSSFSPLMVEKTKTNNSGQFSFERLFLKDSAEVILMGENEKGRSKVKVIPDFQETPDTLVLIEIIKQHAVRN